MPQFFSYVTASEFHTRSNTRTPASYQPARTFISAHVQFSSTRGAYYIRCVWVCKFKFILTFLLKISHTLAHDRAKLKPRRIWQWEKLVLSAAPDNSCSMWQNARLNYSLHFSSSLRKRVSDLNERPNYFTPKFCHDLEREHYTLTYAFDQDLTHKI